MKPLVGTFRPVNPAPEYYDPLPVQVYVFAGRGRWRRAAFFFRAALASLLGRRAIILRSAIHLPIGSKEALEALVEEQMYHD